MALVRALTGTVLGLNSVLHTSWKALGGVRSASKKVAASGARPGNHGKAGNHGWKRQHNQKVTHGTTLAHQYNLRYCPGLNVGIGRRGQLYAKVDGTVKITCERTNFDPEDSYVKKWYPNHENILYKKYYNVLPEPQHQRFNLIEVV